MNHIRNFSIIAHINHGKSTLADRFLELTGTIPESKMRPQYLDQMSLERERGITIKMQPVQMRYIFRDKEYILNLIDTPGHVDFAYEVSRALAAVEGAILLVDAQKGIQAQTLSHLRLAQKQKLKIIPVVNKIDLPQARTEVVKEEVAHLLDILPSQVMEISAKTNNNVQDLLERVIDEVPPPIHDKAQKGTNALIFDSFYDPFKGVVAHVRVFSGSLKRADQVVLLRQNVKAELIEVGIFGPEQKPQQELACGIIGYVATGLKEPGLVKVGETIALKSDALLGMVVPLHGYEEPQAVVFASFYPKDASEFETLRIALDRLKLNDASISYEPESSAVLGRGFKVGFLGLLHLEIATERLRREFKLELIATTPSVAHKVVLKGKREVMVYSPTQIPQEYEAIAEPWVELEIISPPHHVSAVTQLIERNRGIVGETKYLGADYLLVNAQAPLSEIIVNFFDALKSATSGFASMSYKIADFRPAALTKLDILVNGDRVDGLSRIVPEESAYYEGKRMVEKLKVLLPPEQFQIIIQAAIGSRVVARETVRAMRKDVTGYLYGGDVTRKMKLLKKQKKGKQKLQQIGKVKVPPSVFLELLKSDT